eukprot:CAMPEP_0169394086 /NCGR_PEP_ID=MMETSP1017-20121227/49795_1 /TAXON_ID=342587 /ORGANISM="Karlodinium micrum, Strain CCMP2283" /LENGTH=49 /DNA_ID= /DNA_START= /DNA_END= /DNA_ORIENTATION=
MPGRGVVVPMASTIVTSTLVATSDVDMAPASGLRLNQQAVSSFAVFRRL